MARPTKYRKEYAQLAYNYCLLGATDIQLAAYFDVEEKTINNWKKQQPKFLQSLKDGKDKADADVGASLYQRATGYSHPDTDIRVIEGKIIMTEITKHYPPDTASMIFWLKNRTKTWRDKHDHDVHIDDLRSKSDAQLDDELSRLTENDHLTTDNADIGQNSGKITH